MIRFVSGVLEYVEPSEIIINQNGIGYRIFVSQSVLEQLPRVGEHVKVFTYMNVREDAMQLFGFLDYADLKMFELLITVNGIGPKAANGIMGALRADEIRYAVMAEDSKAIAKAPGVGPKMAKKVILELKDKIDLEDMVTEQSDGKTDAVTDEHITIVQDAIEALEVLGYSKTEAAKAVRSVEITEDMMVEELLKLSLKKLG